MREYDQHPCDPGIPLSYQIIDDGVANQPRDSVNHVDLVHGQITNDGSRCGWFEAVPLPSHHQHHQQPAPHQTVRDTAQLMRQQTGSTEDGLAGLTLRDMFVLTLYHQPPRQIAGPQTLRSFVDPGHGGQDSAAVSTFQGEVPPLDRDFSSTIQGCGDESQTGPKLPPLRSELRREDTRLPGIHEILNLPMCRPEIAPVQPRKHPGEPFPMEEALFVGDRSKRTHKHKKRSFASQDGLDKAGPVCYSAPVALNHPSFLHRIIRPADMVPPSPKRRRFSPAESFEIPRRPQALYSPPENPIGESVQDSVWPTPEPESPHPSELEANKATPQANLIAGLVWRPDFAASHSAYDVFTEEQCDKILWLALHGVPSPTVAQLVYREVPKLKTATNKWKFVAGLDKLVQCFIAELAMGGDKACGVDEMVEHLLQQGDRLSWSPYLLRQAAGIMKTSGDEATHSQESRESASERHALSKWRSDHGGENAVPAVTGRTKAEYKAFRGYIREGIEREVMDQLGYREGTHEAERHLMKRLLLEIRELGKLPDRLAEGRIAALTP